MVGEVRNEPWGVLHPSADLATHGFEPPGGMEGKRGFRVRMVDAKFGFRALQLQEG